MCGGFFMIERIVYLIAQFKGYSGMQRLKVGLFSALFLIAAGCSTRLPQSPVTNRPANGVSEGEVTPTPGRMTSIRNNHMMEPISSDPQGEIVTEKGGQPLRFTMDEDIKVFELTSKAVNWPILDDVCFCLDL